MGSRNVEATAGIEVGYTLAFEQLFGSRRRGLLWTIHQLKNYEQADDPSRTTVPLLAAESISVASSFGAAGGLIVLLLWVYYSAQIFLLGAEFTKVFAECHGSKRRVG
jgi:Virulence factor BrkB